MVKNKKNYDSKYYNVCKTSRIIVKIYNLHLIKSNRKNNRKNIKHPFLFFSSEVESVRTFHY